MKNKKIFVTILLLLGILLLIPGIILIYLSGAKTDVSKSDNMSTKIKSLLKNDYIVSNLIYGTPKVKDIPNVTIDNVEYKLVDDDNITGIESLHKIINNKQQNFLLSTISVQAKDPKGKKMSLTKYQDSSKKKWDGAAVARAMLESHFDIKLKMNLLKGY